MPVTAANFQPNLTNSRSGNKSMSEQNSLKSFIDSLGDCFFDLKKKIDKVPKAVSIFYTENEGYVMDCDLSLIEQFVAGQDLNG